MKNITEYINEGKLQGRYSNNAADVKYMFSPGQDFNGFKGVIIGKPFKKNDTVQYEYEDLVKKYFKVGETQLDPFEDAPRNQLFVWFVYTTCDAEGLGYIHYFGEEGVSVII
jgi:hypothetical protein